MGDDTTRRAVLRTAPVALLGAVAGCLGGNSEDGDGDTPEPTTAAPTTTTAAATTTAAGTTGQPSVEEFLADTSNFDGVVDRTGSDAVGVEVGVEANGAFFGFGPPAVRVDAGTTVTWTWTGQGGTHNVVARHGGSFESEQTDAEGHTFQHAFDATGTALYVCAPHEGVGMKGAVVVE